MYIWLDSLNIGTFQWSEQVPDSKPTLEETNPAELDPIWLGKHNLTLQKGITIKPNWSNHLNFCPAYDFLKVL